MSIMGNPYSTGSVNHGSAERNSAPERESPDKEKSQIITTANARKQSDPTTSGVNADLEVDHAALDEPRSKWQAAEEAAAQAENQLSLVLEQLDDNAERRSADEAALQAAVDQQAELKRAIKTSAEQRETLRKARSKAQREAEEARKRAQAAEAKYDEALLAEVLAAQKSKDLSAPDGQAQAVRDEADAVAVPVAQSTAQKTAAAVTARKAGA
jgi:chromosome segregation ATPase